MFISWMELFSMQKSSNRDMGLLILNTLSSNWRSSGDMRRRRGE
jgi:hypothetical protein